MLKAKLIALDIAGWGTGLGSIAIAVKDVNNMLLGAGGLILCGLQIYHTCIRIKKEKKTP